MCGEEGPRPASGLKITYLHFKTQKLSLSGSREDGLRPKPVYSSTLADRCSLNKGNSCSCIKGLSNEHGSEWESSYQVHLSAASNQAVR